MKNLLLTLIVLNIGLFIQAQNNTINEGFESWPAPGWNTYELSLGGEWVHTTLYGPDLGYGGGNGAQHRINNDNCNNWLVSPAITVQSEDYQLQFFEKSEDLQYYVFAGVYISTQSGNPIDGDFELFSESLQSDGYYTEHSLDLSAYAGQEIYIAFVFIGTWHVWNVDEVSVGPQNYTDGALKEISHPTGIDNSGSIEEVKVILQNLGTETISEAEISWLVNDLEQTPYQASSLNLQSGQSTELTLGSFDFSEPNDYVIECSLEITSDFNPENNETEGVYFVSDPKDIRLLNLYPEGYAPEGSNLEMIFEVENAGDFPIDSLHFIWTIDGGLEESLSVADTLLEPGQVAQFNVATIALEQGAHEITGTVNISADANLENNSRTSYTAINTFWESFEGNHFPPEGWTAENYPYVDYFLPEPHGSKYYFSQSDDNYFGRVSDTLYTPLLNIESGDSIRFWINNSAFFTSIDHLVWKDGVTGEVFFLESIESELEDWEEVIIDLSPATGINYIGFTNDPNGGYAHFKLDLIQSGASVHHFEHDLGIISFSFENPVVLDSTHSFKIQLRNYGLQSINGSEYTFELRDLSNALIHSFEGVSLDSWEERTLQLDHAFSEIINSEIRLIIQYESDGFQKNNSSVLYPINTVPELSEMNLIGEKEMNDLQFPFNSGGSEFTLGTDDVSQHIYYTDELGNAGYIYGIRLYYQGLILRGQDLPLTVWVKPTEQQDLSAGWMDFDDSNVVFEDTVTTFPGDGSIYIPFNEPILYSGLSNLAIQYHQYNPGWPFVGTGFTAENVEVGPIRLIGLSDMYDLDIDNLPDFFAERTSISSATFVKEPITQTGSIAGQITDLENAPIENAIISIEDIGISVQSDENGQYSFPELPYSSYEIKASSFGFEDEVANLTLESNEAIQNFTMELLPIITIQGIVYGSDDPTTPLQDVEIQLTGYTNLNATTSESGEFLLSGVYGFQTYQFEVSKYGYETIEYALDVEDNNLNLETIILDQEFLSAINVSAFESNGTGNISWNNPLTGIPVTLQNDENAISYSWTNEPYENVWLGNKFEVNQPITIQSVEVQWDIYENAHDYVTLDILDENGEMLAQSRPFQTYNDSVMQIEIPNLTLSNDFYAMIQWKDNEESTDPLAIDYSDGVQNSAYIFYPNEEPQLLSEFIGSADGSFLIRVHSVAPTDSVVDEEFAYDIYRGLAEDLTNIPSSQKINDFPVNSLEFTDPDLATVESGEYIYGVKTAYNEGDAEITFSNRIDVITSTLELELESLRFYPNPASDLVNLSGAANFQIKIFDMQGKLIYTNKLADKILQLDVRSWPNGNYILELSNDQTEKTKTAKLIVSR